MIDAASGTKAQTCIFLLVVISASGYLCETHQSFWSLLLQENVYIMAFWPQTHYKISKLGEAGITKEGDVAVVVSTTTIVSLFTVHASLYEKYLPPPAAIGIGFATLAALYFSLFSSK